MEKKKESTDFEQKSKVGDYMTASLAYNEAGEFSGRFGEGRQGIFIRDNQDGTILLQGEGELYLCMAPRGNSTVPDKELSSGTKKFVDMIRGRMHEGKYVFPKDIPGATKIVEADKENTLLYRDHDIRDITKATPQQIIDCALPVIMAKSPQFLLKHQIDINNIEEKLKKAYPDEKSCQAALYAFKIHFYHLAFFLVNREVKELSKSTQRIKQILAGAWEDEGRKREGQHILLITRNPFPTAVQIAESLKRRLRDDKYMEKYLESKMGFLRKQEMSRLLTRIRSSSDNPERAVKILETEASRYFNELRDLCANEGLPIPDYYVPKMKEKIGELRKHFLI